MKRAKGTDSWRGGRGRARCRYYINPKGLTLVEWSDGSYEWIPDDILFKTRNRVRAWSVKGYQAFSTRRAAERAIDKIPYHAVELFKRYRQSKAWVYPPCKIRELTVDSKDRDIQTGVVVTFKCQVRLYNFSKDPTVWIVDSQLADESSFGVVIESDGSISQVLVDGLMSWVESRFLVPVAV